MRFILRILTILTALVPAAATAQVSLDARLDALRRDHGVPAIAAAVVRGGDTVAIGTAGVRVLGGDITVAPDDRFHLGSDTKAMTATLAGHLVETGRLRWDSTIGEVLGKDVPGLNAKLAAVTLAQLLAHSGGLPTDNDEIGKIYFNGEAATDDPPQGLRLRALAAVAGSEPKVPEPAFQYSNLGYTVAGAMLEKAAGEPWERLMFTRLFEPLGLRTAGLGAQATFGRYDAPVGHQVDDKGAIKPMPWGWGADVPPVMGPAGIAHMSIGDFARWAGWNAGRGRRGPALVKPETLATIHKPAVDVKFDKPKPGSPATGQYALGWAVIKYEWTPRPVLAHDGSNGMNFARILVDAEADLAVVLTTNISPAKADAAASALLQQLYQEYAVR